MRPTLKAVTLGRLVFEEALVLQRKVANSVREDNLDGVLLLLEHEPVYTVGIRHKCYDEKLKERLVRTGAAFCQTDRGGLITFHGPGQLVAYPVLNLKRFGLTMKRYVESLEESVIRMCGECFAVEAHRSPHTGVWVGDNKLCAIGVHGSRYITTHGLALNCNTNLDWFAHIVPCGIPDKGVTSLTKLLDKEEVTVQQTVPCFVNAFQQVFNCHVKMQHHLSFEYRNN